MLSEGRESARLRGDEGAAPALRGCKMWPSADTGIWRVSDHSHIALGASVIVYHATASISVTISRQGHARAAHSKARGTSGTPPLSISTRCMCKTPQWRARRRERRVQRSRDEGPRPPCRVSRSGPGLSAARAVASRSRGGAVWCRRGRCASAGGARRGPCRSVGAPPHVGQPAGCPREARVCRAAGIYWPKMLTYGKIQLLQEPRRPKEGRDARGLATDSAETPTELPAAAIVRQRESVGGTRL